MGGLKDCYQGPYALFYFAFRAQEAGWRVLFDPQAIFCSHDSLQQRYFVEEDIKHFNSEWKEKLKMGDPFYNSSLSQSSESYELDSIT